MLNPLSIAPLEQTAIFTVNCGFTICSGLLTPGGLGGLTLLNVLINYKFSFDHTLRLDLRRKYFE